MDSFIFGVVEMKHSNLVVGISITGLLGFVKRVHTVNPHDMNKPTSTTGPRFPILSLGIMC